MQKYECVFILKADQPEAAMAARVERVGGIIAEHDGKITAEDHWGIRRLAYEIDHETKGNYMLLKFLSEGTAVAAIERSLRQDDQILRHLVVVDEEWQERNRAAIAKRRREAAENTASSEKRD